jgi:sulfate adenylyltransferase
MAGPAASGSGRPTSPQGRGRRAVSAPQTPVGGTLIDRVLTGDALEAAREKARSLPGLMIDPEAAIALEMIATGVFSPLVGAPSRDDNESVVEHGRLLDGTPWPIPLSFSPAGKRNASVMRHLVGGEEVALLDQSGRPVALMHIEEVYDLDREGRALSLFHTRAHRAQQLGSL